MQEIIRNINRENKLTTRKTSFQCQLRKPAILEDRLESSVVAPTYLLLT